ncbi:MAG: hypothetical protein UT02_C0002G0003 [Parcubacteria group bacterium GW2011_GWC2_38_7]|nr:MAG: hypothetical protein UT02_C0002G0003 [Parcubacteria group bacterium GW2011_GWC2_38_7]
MTRRMSTAEVERAIREGLPKGYASSVRFLICKARAGFLGLVDTHQVGGVRVLKAHFKIGKGETLVEHMTAYFKSAIPEDTVASVPREFVCAQVKTAIREALKNAEGIRFDVRPVREGLSVIIPDHRAKKVDIPKAHIGPHTDNDYLVTRAVAHFQQYLVAA